jgi:hypothetical protein
MIQLLNLLQHRLCEHVLFTLVTEVDSCHSRMYKCHSAHEARLNCCEDVESLHKVVVFVQLGIKVLLTKCLCQKHDRVIDSALPWLGYFQNCFKVL